MVTSIFSDSIVVHINMIIIGKMSGYASTMMYDGRLGSRVVVDLLTVRETGVVGKPIIVKVKGHSIIYPMLIYHTGRFEQVHINIRYV